ncbi:uncharacterized protein [Aristolochia californica]|uniref:uncharacterized protein n=1 Tax=Aristolochia californica TaxID=171875 RepID=UPI0035DDB629
MAASIIFPSNRYHVRSSSIPSRSHRTTVKVVENLNQLREWESLPSISLSSLCTGLSGLSDLYQSIDDLLQLPLTQQALFACNNKKFVDEALDASLRLLDSCANARDVMLQMTDAVKDLQLALRRRVAPKKQILEKALSTYMSLAKKIKQKAKKCLKALKTQKFDFSSLSVGSQLHNVEVMTVIRDARSFAISILEKLLSFVSCSNPRSMKTSSIVLKWIGSGRVACNEEAEKMNDTERLHASLSVLCSYKSENESDQVQNAQEQLKTFLDGIQGLEVGLDLLHRRLIQTRVSLLNILSH